MLFAEVVAAHEEGSGTKRLDPMANAFIEIVDDIGVLRDGVSNEWFAHGYSFPVENQRSNRSRLASATGSSRNPPGDMT